MPDLKPLQSPTESKPMLALSFNFPAGRYHATPWDKHVNEGDVAWPPEPWRVLRALIATWHHKIKHRGQHSETTLSELIDALAQTLPDYTLPPASHSHTRHYLPQFKAGDTSLVFDAFAAVDRQTPLYMTWPDTQLSATQQTLLDDLLEALGYLGRAESWVEAKRITAPPASNCTPGDVALDESTGELHEVVSLFAPVSASHYAELRAQYIADKKQAKKLATTLPEQLLSALSVETALLQKQGWNQPPAAQKVSYLRPVGALRPQRSTPVFHSSKISSINYLLVGKPLPRVEDSLRIGELARCAIMSQFKRHGVPSAFSGHDLPKDNRHKHAFYLPWDSTGDGRLDRLLIHVPMGFDDQQRLILERLSKIYERGGQEWKVIIEASGDPIIAQPLTQSSTVWESVTPYLHPWHTKKHLGIKDQIRKECRLRDLPEIEELQSIETIKVGNKNKRPIHFRRFRKKRGMTQADGLGSAWRLEFKTPVSGPIALGYGCHFGLGLFRPVDHVQGGAPD